MLNSIRKGNENGIYPILSHVTIFFLFLFFVEVSSSQPLPVLCVFWALMLELDDDGNRD